MSMRRDVDAAIARPAAAQAGAFGAAELARLDGVRRCLVVVSTSHRHRDVPPDDVVVHRLDDLLPSHLATVGGFPTTTVPRTIVDLAVPSAKLVVEADGRRWHARLDAMATDRRRDRVALAAGWATGRFVHRDLVDHPAGAAAELRTIVAARFQPFLGRSL